jgi:tetratricopeptide (TPR) repeat protein
LGVAAITIGGVNLEEGVEGLRRGVALAEKLPPSDPRRRRIRRDAAVAHLEIGEVLQKAGRTALAGRALREAKALVATVATNDARQLAADRLVLVVSSAWLGEKEAAQTACREVAGTIEPVGGNSELVRLVRTAVRAVGIDRPEASELLAAAAGEPPAALNDAIRRDPKSARAHRDRANWFGRHGSWKNAAEDLAEANRLEPDHGTALYLGAVLVHLDEVDRYRELCRAMMSQSAGTTSNMNAERTAKLCLYRADSGVNAGRLGRLVELGVSGDRNQWGFEFFIFCKGLHAYRAGQFADALTVCREARRLDGQRQAAKWGLGASSLAVEAMALHHLGDEAAALRSLREAKRRIDDGFSFVDTQDGWWGTWVEASLLYREAEALIDGPEGAKR